MPNKITDEIKNNTAFLLAKVKGLTNREAARMYFITDGMKNVTSFSGNTLEAYLLASKEPKIERSAFVDGNSRSKLVMEYEKHRRAFNQLVAFRAMDKANCDKIFESCPIDKIAAGPNVRIEMLNWLNTQVNISSK
jgi:hypothetical protein